MESTVNKAIADQSWEGFQLSRQQERLIAQHSLTSSNHVEISFALRGNLNQTALKAAVNEVIHDHEILRTSFRKVHGEKSCTLMVIAEPTAVNLEIIDLREQVDDNNKQNKKDAFNNVTLFIKAEKQYLLIIRVPRLCLDQLSSSSFMGLLAQEYAKHHRNMKGHSEPAIQYADYAQWQLEELAKIEQAGTKSEFNLSPSNIPALHLPLELKSQDKCLSTFELHINQEEMLSRLTQSAQAQNTSLRTIIHSCWCAALWRVGEWPEKLLTYTNLPFRSFSGLANALGLFETYLPHVVDITPSTTFEALVLKSHQDLERLERMQTKIPCGMLQPNEKLPGNIGYTFIQTPEILSSAGLSFANETTLSPVEQLKLELIACANDSALQLTIRYENSGFNKEGILPIAQAFLAAFETVIHDSNETVGGYKLLSDVENKTLIDSYNPVTDKSECLSCWHYTFSELAASTPGLVALTCAESIWSYRELEDYTNQLARCLMVRGAEPGKAVGLVMECSDLAIATIIAVHKIGAFYVPIDPALPRNRYVYFLEQSKPTLLVSLSKIEKDSNQSIPVFQFDLEQEVVRGFDSCALEPVAKLEDLAYVIYTSGSTGTPKGVAVEHRQCAHYVDGVIDRLGLQSGPSFLSVGTLATDLGSTSIFPALVTGGNIEISPFSSAANAQELADYMSDQSYDILKLTPSHLASLFTLVKEPKKLMPNKALILGGEILSWGLLRLFNSFAGNCKIFNHYGPTETCVGVVAGEVKSDEMAQLTSTAPLGKPLKHARTYILDENGAPVLKGCTGEIYIGGQTVSRGYVNAESLTQELFVYDPWGIDSNSRMYRSGDRARLLPNGSIEFLRRVDRQIKIRGFRVELGEIEAVLRIHSDVLDSCVVLAGESGGAHLVAYVITSDSSSGDASWLRGHLEDYLPSFMLPTNIVSIPRFPLNAVGKIDFKMLPEPNSVIKMGDTSQVEASTQTEKMVVILMKELLLVENIGRTDDFFDIGGHSLLAIKLASKIRKGFNIEFSLKNVFVDATVVGLSEKIDEQLSNEMSA